MPNDGLVWVMLVFGVGLIVSEILARRRPLPRYRIDVHADDNDAALELLREFTRTDEDDRC